MARALALLGVVALALSSHVARAASNARLVYARSTDAASCPDEGALREAVTARVGYDPFFPWANRTVIASITRRGRAFVASVDLVDENGFTRGAHELRTESACRELLDAVALSIAIAIDPRVLTAVVPAEPKPHEEPPPPPPTPPPPPSLPPAPAAPPDDRVARARDDVARFEASAGVVATTFSAPSPTAGFALGTDARWRIFSVGIEGRVDLPAGSNATGGGSVSSWLALGALVPCVNLGAFFGCALAQGGVMETSSAGVADHRSTSLAWWAAGGRAGVVLPLAGDVRLRLHGDLVADLDPATLRLNGGNAWTAPPVAASIGVDAVLRFR